MRIWTIPHLGRSGIPGAALDLNVIRAHSVESISTTLVLSARCALPICLPSCSAWAFKIQSLFPLLYYIGNIFFTPAIIPFILSLKRYYVTLSSKVPELRTHVIKYHFKRTLSCLQAQYHKRRKEGMMKQRFSRVQWGDIKMVGTSNCEHKGTGKNWVVRHRRGF